MRQSRRAPQNEERATRHAPRHCTTQSGTPARSAQATGWSARSSAMPLQNEGDADYGAAREAEAQASLQASMQAAREADLEGEHVLRAANRVRRRRRNKARAAGVAKALVAGTISLGLWVAISIGLADYRWAQNELGTKRVQLAGLQVQLKAGKQRLNALQLEKGRAQSLVEHGYVRPGDRILLFPPEPEAANAPLASAPSDSAPSPDISKTLSRGNGNAAGNAAQPKDSAKSATARAADEKQASAPSSQQTSPDEIAPDRTASDGAASDGAASDGAASGSTASDPSSGKAPSMWRRAGRTLGEWWQAARNR